ncbi:class I SAM-dependent methyltransferase [bacterium]|nr:class I SAM-dependent methyltransferase [bacterium]
MNANLTQNNYLLGHSNEEQQRLARQSSFFEDMTEFLLVKAGITSGMTVLDAGCGIGDVSFVLSRLVGPSGSVIAIDQSDLAICSAQKRASERQIRNVIFLQRDVYDPPLSHKVNAVTGRFILMHLHDPVEAIRSLCESVQSGGVVTFQDFSVIDAKSISRCPDV